MDCGDCRKPRYAVQCNCDEHLRICEEQQRAERAEESIADLGAKLAAAHEFIAAGCECPSPMPTEEERGACESCCFLGLAAKREESPT